MRCWVKHKRKCSKRLILVCCVIAMVTVFSGTFTFESEQNTRKRRLKDIIIKPNLAPSNQYDVILSAYMNSGSRFTSRLLGFRSDTFFMYEPLWKFSVWDYFKPPNLQCSTLLGSCRKISTEEVNSFQPFKHRADKIPIVSNISRYTDDVRPADVFLRVLSSIFNCNFIPLVNVIQERVQDNPAYSGPSWDDYRQCLSKFRPKSECLKKLETLCKQRKHRVTKILRSTLGTFRPLLETNPRLKIVHLVRDPRAIIHSRIYSRHYPVYGYRENSSLETNLCDKMLQDYKDGIELMREFPNRVIFLYYEDLLTNLHVRLKGVMEFLNMEYNKTHVDILAQINVNLSPPEKGNEHVQYRKENNAEWWRKYMQQFDIDRVNKITHTRMYMYNLFDLPKILTNCLKTVMRNYEKDLIDELRNNSNYDDEALLSEDSDEELSQIWSLSGNSIITDFADTEIRILEDKSSDSNDNSRSSYSHGTTVDSFMCYIDNSKSNDKENSSRNQSNQSFSRSGLRDVTNDHLSQSNSSLHQCDDADDEDESDSSTGESSSSDDDMFDVCIRESQNRRRRSFAYYDSLRGRKLHFNEDKVDDDDDDDDDYQRPLTITPIKRRYSVAESLRIRVLKMEAAKSMALLFKSRCSIDS